MAARPGSPIGDLIRTARALELDPSEWHVIAPLFGLSLVVPGDSMAGADAGAGATQARARPPSPEPAEPSDQGRRPPRVAQPPRPPEPRRSPRSATLRPVTSAPTSPPLWLGAETVGETRAEHRLRLVPDPLLVERWTTGILFALMAAAARSGAIDAALLVERFARGDPIDDVPYEIYPTLARGAQILIDTGAAMAPFAYDTAGLARTAEQVLGGAPFDVLRFSDCPLRGAGPGPRRTWRPFEPPMPARPLLLLSDLGAGASQSRGDPAFADEWLDFFTITSKAGCPAVALVPYPLGRVPRALRRVVHAVAWRRQTSVGTVRQTLGGPHAVP